MLPSSGASKLKVYHIERKTLFFSSISMSKLHSSLELKLNDQKKHTNAHKHIYIYSGHWPFS